MISILTGAGYTAWAWLAPWIIKHGVKIGIGAAIVAVYLGNAAMHRAEGRNQVVQASKAAGAARNEATRQIRNKIDASTAMQRLRREYADN